MKTSVEQVGLDFSNTEIAFSSKTDSELRRTARIFRLMNNATLVSVGSRLGLLATKWGLPFTNRIIEDTIFFQFCGGKTLEDSQDSIDRLADSNILTVLDYGAEGKSAEADLVEAQREVLRAIDYASGAESIPVVSTKLTSLASNDILTKWQAKDVLSADEKSEFDRVLARVDAVCKAAHEKGVALFVDAEESWMQVTIDHIVDVMMEQYNRDKVVVYNTYQMYRHDKLTHLKSAFERAQQKGYMLGAKLVRGAYMDKERLRAKEHGYPSPIQTDKQSTDRDYDAGVEFCIDRYEQVALCNASHNLNSNLHMAQLITERGLQKNHPHLNFCQLYGMSDYITFNLASAGYNVAKYVVYGPIKEVIPYLVRRAEENTSVTGDMSRELSLIMTEMKRRGL